MDAIKAKIGERYLNGKGTPITVVGHKGEKVVLSIKGSDNDVFVEKTYELKPFKESGVNKEAKVLAQANGKGKVGRAPKTNTIASFIDPRLFEGRMTVKEIAEAVSKEAGNLVKQRDMAAVESNVRARMVSYSRKGWQIEKDDHKRVKVIKPKA